MADTYDVFLSYARADGERVRRLAENLHRAGLKVFFDEWELGPGDVLVHGLDRGLREARNGVVVVTPTALTRPWVLEEYAAMVTRAVEGGFRVVPVLLVDAELPPLLASRIWVDLRQADGPVYEGELARLVAMLRGEKAGPPPRGEGLRPDPAGAFRVEGRMRMRLRITAGEVAVSVEGKEVARQRPAGLAGGAALLLHEWRRALQHPAEAEAEPVRAVAGAATARESMRSRLNRELGAALTAGFLDGAAGEAVRVEVERAVALGEALALALEVEERLAELPWELLRLPAASAAEPVGPPLALHPNVELYRVPAGGAAAVGATTAVQVPRPLRVLVAIGSPEEQNRAGELLDMEAELGRILDAVESARRQSRAHVRILPRGSVRAIREALAAERYHVLHVSCHAAPGVLILEDEEGGEDRVDAERFCSEALVPGRGVPLVVLAGCATALGGRAAPSRAAGGVAAGPRESSAAEGSVEEGSVAGERLLPGLARQLLAHGVPAVLAMQAPVSDRYATELGARLYATLAGSPSPEPLAALAAARRQVERESEIGGGGRPGVGELAEWPTPVLYLRSAPLPLYDSSAPYEEIESPPEPRLAEGITVRAVGEFVGRRREERLALAALRKEGSAGVLLRGLGGVGKSSLAAELVRWSLGEGWQVASLRGEVSPDGILAEVARCLRAWAGSGHGGGEPWRDLANAVQRPDVDWEERFELLSRQALGSVPLLLLLDNFEDNLLEGAVGTEGEPAKLAGPAALRNEQLGELLARWALRPGRSRLLVTCRYPIELPRQAERRLTGIHLGPLSFAEARKLMWRLPGLDALTPAERRRAYEDVGGHPRALEYLDALLRGGEARFDDVAERMEAALAARGVAVPRQWEKNFAGDLGAATAEAVSLAAGDVLLDRLLEQLAEVPLATELLLGASVYREPVDRVGLAWQVGEVREAPAAAEHDIEEARKPPVVVPAGFESARTALENVGLLAPAGAAAGGLFAVHRWTAAALAGLAAVEDLRRAQEKAAAYWRWRVRMVPQSQQQDVEQLLEARYHHRQAGDVAAAVEVTAAVCSQLDQWGAYRREEQLCIEALGWVAERSGEAAVFIHQLGMIAQARGDYDQALSWYRKSLAIKEELGNRAGMANSYHQLGMIAQARGDYDQALSWYRKSLAIKEELGNSAGMASSYHQLGTIAQQRGDYDQALSWYRKSLEILEELGNRADMAISYNQLGMIAQQRGDYDQALSWYRKSLAIKEELGNRAGMAISYHQLGMIAQQRGDYDQALSWYRKSLAIKEELGNRAGMAISYHQVGMIAEERGDYDQALSWYRKSLEISEELGDRDGMASSYHQLGMVAEERGDYDQALSWYRKSLEIEEALGNRAGAARTTSQIGVLLTTTGSPAEGVPFNLRSLAMRVRLGLPEVRINLHWLARQRDALGDERFQALLREHAGEGGSATVLRLMNQSEELKSSSKAIETEAAPDRRQSRGAPAAPADDAEYGVWYGTNRRPLDGGDASKGYGIERDSTTRYGLCRVFIPRSHKIGSTGSPWWKRWLSGADDRLRMLEIRELAAASFWVDVAAQLARSDVDDRDAVLLLHGYNVSFEDAALRAAQIGFDLSVKGLMAFFSWPSQGTLDGYLADEAAIEASADAITDFMVELAERSGARNVHVIAHSMGNRAALEAVRSMAARAQRRRGARFGQFILAAADVDADTFRQRCGAYADVAERATLYVSARDRAVELSRWLHRFPRAGFTPPVLVSPGIDTVSVTNVDLTLLGHGYIAETRDVLHDMHMLLRHGAPPEQRFGLREERTAEGGRYWCVGA